MNVIAAQIACPLRACDPHPRVLANRADVRPHIALPPGRIAIGVILILRNPEVV